MTGEHGSKEEAATQTIFSLKVTNMNQEGELMAIGIRSIKILSSHLNK